MATNVDVTVDTLSDRLGNRLRAIDDEIHKAKMLLQNRDYAGMYKAYDRALGLINQWAKAAATLAGHGKVQR